MEELQIPTHRIVVEMFTSDGAHVCGSLYLTETASHRSGAVEVATLLNDERPFVPFLAAGQVPDAGNAVGQTIINKNHIVRVHLADATPSDLHGDGLPDHGDPPCMVRMADGSRLRGRVHLDTPRASSRLVDKLNLSPQFLSLITDNGIDFVHVLHVVSVC